MLICFPAETAQEYYWMVPLERNPRFLGRKHEITRLEEFIEQKNGQNRIAICGLKGIGKTQVAVELAFRMNDRNSEFSISWIPCTSYETVEQAYIVIAQTLGTQDAEPENAKDLVKSHLNQKQSGKWLLVFDNADCMDMWISGPDATTPALKEFLPQNEQGRILFITRNQKLAVKLVSSNVIPISEPDKDIAMKILQTSIFRNHLLGDNDAAAILFEQLEFLPLAISQAAAYINENNITLTDYISLLRSKEADVAEMLSEEFKDDGRDKDSQNAVATTWLVSFRHIQRLNNLAIEYLFLMACVNPRDIPKKFLPEDSFMKEKMEAIGVLKAYDFVSGHAIESSLNLHRLVHLATRNWMRKKLQFARQISKTADRLSWIFSLSNYSERPGIFWRPYLPHALSLIGEVEFRNQQENYISLFHDVAKCLFHDGRKKEAAVVLNSMHSIPEKVNLLNLPLQPLYQEALDG